jgi:hypothetical protein
MSDPFESYGTGLEAPATRASAVTPNDSTDLNTFARALYVGTGGNITLDTVGGDSSVAFANVPDGFVLSVRTQRVRSTGTTASNIVALW